MNKLDEIKNQYITGEIPKAEYIEKMYSIHSTLHDYASFIKGTSIEKIEISNGEVCMHTRPWGVKIIVSPEDRRVAPLDALNFGSYEHLETEMMLRLIEDGFHVFDIGANVGWYSLIFSRKFKNLMISAFEPIPATYNLLKRHISINQASGITPYPFGFSDQEADLEFYFYPEGPVNASLANLNNHQNTQKIRCHVKRMDQFVEETNAKIDFIKCDVEGAELLVFKGGIKSISEQKPIIFTEMLRKWSAKFNYHPNEIIALFETIGYDCFVINGTKLARIGSINDDTIQTNFVFLHVEKHKDLIHSLMN